ncbi:MAG: hypothetical protein ACN6P8_11970 [Achromobacter piechaudii]
MTIRRSVSALSLVAMLAPMAASAAGGAVRFSGAIAEPTRCQVAQSGNVAQAVPRVSCASPTGAHASASAQVVKVSTKVLPPLPGRDGARDVPHRLVKLNYL